MSNTKSNTLAADLRGEIEKAEQRRIEAEHAEERRQAEAIAAKFLREEIRFADTLAQGCNRVASAIQGIEQQRLPMFTVTVELDPAGATRSPNDSDEAWIHAPDSLVVPGRITLANGTEQQTLGLTVRANPHGYFTHDLTRDGDVSLPHITWTITRGEHTCGTDKQLAELLELGEDGAAEFSESWAQTATRTAELQAVVLEALTEGRWDTADADQVQRQLNLLRHGMECIERFGGIRRPDLDAVRRVEELVAVAESRAKGEAEQRRAFIRRLFR